MISMGIDLALNKTGVVILEDGTLLSAMVIKTETDDELYKRVQHNVDTITKIIKGFNTHINVAIEGLSFGSVSSSTRTLAINYGCVVFNALYKRANNIVEVPPTTLKKFATGNGKADKNLMVECLPELIKEEFKQDFKKSNGLYDVTDAYHLARYIEELAKSVVKSKDK